MRKVLALTTIRSDYALMSSLYQLLHQDSQIELKLIVAGAHLSPFFGNTVREIENDGLTILTRLETLISSDSKEARLKSASILMQNAIDVVATYAPDVIIFAGDREDVIVAALIGAYLEIPTVHFFGGDHEKDGHVDTAVRHATSKLSSIHMVSIEAHRQRLIRMGEDPKRIFTVGSIALDKFVTQPAAEISEIRKQLKNPTLPNRFALMIFHPITKELDKVHIYFDNILSALQKMCIFTFVSLPNTDPGYSHILDVATHWRHNSNCYFYNNLEEELFLSIYKRAEFIIGNSSSGILEAASIPLAAINVGVRQQGRFADQNIIFCDPKQTDIEAAISQALSPQFRQQVAQVKNSYGNGQSSHKVMGLLKTLNLQSFIRKTEDPLDIAKGVKS